MKILHIILAVILFVALAAVAAALLALGIWGVPPQLADFCPRDILAGNWRGILAGSLAIAFLLLYALSAILARRTRRQVITFENDDGRVTVDTEAVRSYLGGLQAEFAGSNWVKPTVDVRQGALAIRLDLGVKPGTQIPELCRLMQERVKEILREHLGTCDLAGIEMNVHEINGARRTSSSDPA
jgi:uncharacterized alkaline shock family protein YloU